MDLYQKLKKILILLIICIFSLNFNLASAKKKIESLPDNFKNYYNFLQSISTDSVDKQIVELEKYLKEHPNCERVYIHLLEQLVFNDQIEQAKEYFIQLESNQLYRRNSLWGLAKILVLQDSTVKAYRIYKKALRAGSPTFLFLKDYIDFDFAHQNNGIDEIQRLFPSSPEISLINSYYLHKLTNYDEALKKIQMANLVENQFALYVSGLCYWQKKDYEKTKLLIKKCLLHCRLKYDLEFEAFVLIDLRSALDSVKVDKREISKIREHALSIYESIGKRGECVRLVSTILGAKEYTQSNYPQAIIHYQRAFKNALKFNNFEKAAYHSLGMARALNQAEKYSEALDAYETSIFYLKKVNNISFLHSVYIEKGNLFTRLFLHNLAKFEYQKALHLNMSYPVIRFSDSVATRMGGILIREKKYDEAQKLFLGSLNSSRMEKNLNNEAYWNWMLGYCYYNQKEFNLAEEHFRKVCKILEPSLLENPSAIDSSWQAYEFAFSLIRLGDIEIARGNYSQAFQIYNRKILNRVAKIKNDCAVELNYSIGNAYKKMNELDLAIQYYTQAMDAIEKYRTNLNVEQFRIGFFSGDVNSRVYEALIHCNMEKFKQNENIQNLEKVFYYTEMSRARTLRDIKIEKNARIEDSKKYQDYQKACKDLQIIQRQMWQEETLNEYTLARFETARYNLLSKRIQAFQNEFSNDDVQSFSLNNILNGLRKANFGLVLFHITEEISFVLAANDKEVKAITLEIDAEALKASVDSLLSPFHNITINTIDQTPFRASIAFRLYNLLIKPIEQELKLKNRNLVIQDIELMGLPLEMLLVHSPKKSKFYLTDSTSYGQDFLLNRYSFIYSPSTWLQKKTSKKRPTNSNILIFANPINIKQDRFNNPTISASRKGWNSTVLVFAEKEANSIAKLNPDVNVFKKDKATKERFFRNAPKYQNLHFATHAFVDSNFDAFSGLVLAMTEDSTDDGLLMGYEITDLNLNCDLVTLSGCETGRGKKVVGEGSLGLPRLFLGAGAERVLMTHWKVDDIFSSKLMPKFYENFLNKGKTKDEALRKAKIELITNTENNNLYQHPFYWASFALYGNPEIIEHNYYKYGLILILFFVLFLIWRTKLKRNKDN